MRINFFEEFAVPGVCETGGSFFGNGEDLTLGDVAAHLPFICPRSKHFQVLLQYFMIFLNSNRTVKQRIINKESDGRVRIAVYTINIKEK